MKDEDNYDLSELKNFFNFLRYNNMRKEFPNSNRESGEIPFWFRRQYGLLFYLDIYHHHFTFDGDMMKSIVKLWMRRIVKGIRGNSNQ